MKAVYQTQPFGLRRLPYGLLKDGCRTVSVSMFKQIRVFEDEVGVFHVMQLSLRFIEGEGGASVIGSARIGHSLTEAAAVQLANTRSRRLDAETPVRFPQAGAR